MCLGKRLSLASRFDINSSTIVSVVIPELFNLAKISSVPVRRQYTMAPIIERWRFGMATGLSSDKELKLLLWCLKIELFMTSCRITIINYQKRGGGLVCVTAFCCFYSIDRRCPLRQESVRQHHLSSTQLPFGVALLLQDIRITLPISNSTTVPALRLLFQSNHPFCWTMSTWLDDLVRYSKIEIGWNMATRHRTDRKQSFCLAMVISTNNIDALVAGRSRIFGV